ncbi:hypothetical protein FFWV33_14000 [Flavobacterium faecale]|uniref:histidine kinase n=1 Tax=Flavobacterium faecale TaxID=1355330 RepID=A0A2S1LFK0_9FLAO|nr:HAMP domain-containing sensor histidine kinase [Flavobacterium faecale]AWG22560.1 hypothetical protein FFWV33_14000 [Flavobacterium faecale]
MSILSKVQSLFYYSRLSGIILSVVLICLIGFLDICTGVEMAFSLFYVIPIVLLSVQQKTAKIDVIFCATLSAGSWCYSEYTVVSFSHYFFPIWNTGVRFSLFLIIGVLMFNLKQKDRRLSEVNRKLLQLNTEKNKFIGIAAHDLANPIGMIQSFSDLLIESCAENHIVEVSEGLEVIKTLSTNSMSVLKNLLNVSVIESGKIDLKVQELDYIEFIKKQVEYNNILAHNKNIHIEFESTIDSVTMSYDAHYLGQVTGNLLSNAIKYSPSGSTISVRVLAENNYLVTEVKDQGKGIPEKEQGELFMYFQKSSTQPTAGESSTGLGLAIAKQIVNLHQGTIGLKSKINEGATFYFSLPIKN